MSFDKSKSVITQRRPRRLGLLASLLLLIFYGLWRFDVVDLNTVMDGVNSNTAFFNPDTLDATEASENERGSSSNIASSVLELVKAHELTGVPEPVRNSKKVEKEIDSILEQLDIAIDPTVLATMPNMQNGVTVGGDKVTIDSKYQSNHLAYDAAHNFKEIINTSPIVLFVKSTDSKSLVLRKLLSQHYDFSPQFAVVDLDKHSHGAALQKYIQHHRLINFSSKLSNSQDSSVYHNEVPYLFVKGISIINQPLQDDIIEPYLHNNLINTIKSTVGESVMIIKNKIPSNS